MALKEDSFSNLTSLKPAEPSNKARRSGLTNSDSWISGNLAQSKSVKFAAKKEQEYEKDEKESRSGI